MGSPNDFFLTRLLTRPGRHLLLHSALALYAICAFGLPRTTESLVSQPNSRRFAYGTTDKTCREINTTGICDPFPASSIAEVQGTVSFPILSLLDIAHFAMPHCDFASLPEQEYPTDEVALNSECANCRAYGNHLIRRARTCLPRITGNTCWGEQLSGRLTLTFWSSPSTFSTQQPRVLGSELDCVMQRPAATIIRKFLLLS